MRTPGPRIETGRRLPVHPADVMLLGGEQQRLAKRRIPRPQDLPREPRMRELADGEGGGGLVAKQHGGMIGRFGGGGKEGAGLGPWVMLLGWRVRRGEAFVTAATGRDWHSGPLALRRDTCKVDGVTAGAEALATLHFFEQRTLCSCGVQQNNFIIRQRVRLSQNLAYSNGGEK
jgi:hypothetical protein